MIGENIMSNAMPSEANHVQNSPVSATAEKLKMSQIMGRQDYNSIDAPDDEVYTKKTETKRDGLECTENEQM